MKTPSKMTRAALVLCSAAAFAAACDYQKISNQASATNVMVTTLLTTPAVEMKAGALAGNGLDASIPDAGSLLADAGLTIPPQTLVVVFFGERGANLDIAPRGIAGAGVSITEVGGGTWPLSEGAGGAYQLRGEDAGFRYKENATYDFKATFNNQDYVAELQQAPAQERITQFHPASGFVAQTAGEPFTFTRAEPLAGHDRTLGFVQVFPVSGGAQGAPTYSNVPTKPLELLKLVAAPSDWKQTSVTIPGTAFPDKDTNYIIVLQSAKIGGPKSENLFSGSAILGGTADIGVVKTAR